MAVSESNMAEFKMAAIIKLSQNEWVKFFLCKMAESKMAEFKMAAIIKLSENEWALSQIELVWVRVLCKWLNPRWQNSRWKNSRWLPSLSLSDWISLSQSEWNESVFEWIWEKITRCLNPRWQCLNPTWQNSRWLPSSSWVRMNEFESDWTSLSQSFVQNGWIQDGRIQDGCHHLVNQIELVWVRVRVEEECFWVNLRENNKVFESKSSVWIQHGRVQDGCHHQVEWEWMSLSQFELVWIQVLCKMAESKMAEFKMAAIIKLSQNEWVLSQFFLCKGLNPRQQDSRWLPSSSWVRMNEWSFFCTKWLNQGWQISR